MEKMECCAGFGPSGMAPVRTETPRAGLDLAVNIVADKAREFARLGPAAKAALLRRVAACIAEMSADWTRTACEAKRIPFDAPVAGEEWLAGPVVTARNARLLARSLDDIAKHGRPKRGLRAGELRDGRLSLRVFPSGALDAAMFGGFRCDAHMLPGIDERRAHELQAGFYRQDKPEGRVALVLGAGNVTSIPAMDALHKMFVEGRVCIVKMNPANEWIGPALEKALAPLVDARYLRFVYGGAEEGAYLCGHPQVDAVHITGSDRTHDLIVWGPPGPERDRRKRGNDPLLRKPITSELGNVSPVAIVPGDYSDDELRFVARNVAAMVANNASFNCNAGKVLVTAEGWRQKERFMSLLYWALFHAPLRHAWYPGARERFDALLAGRDEPGSVLRIRSLDAKPGELPWTVVHDLDPDDAAEPLFRTEPFCAILSETTLQNRGAPDFLLRFKDFCNDRLWGTLNACIVISPETEKDPAAAHALDATIYGLEYGTVAINHWPALGYGFVSPPWGGHPSSMLADIQSGSGWVHNTFMLEGVEKSVIRGPLVAKPKPAWFCDNRRSHDIGRKLARFEARPSWLKLPSVAWSAIRG